MAKLKKKVVIIGGSGFLGSHLSDIITKNGYSVIMFDKMSSLWLHDDQKMIIGNILNQEEVVAAIDDADYVYHLAGIADISEGASNVRNTIENNIIGSVNVIEACVQSKIKRLLFASTVYVYSDRGSFYRVTKQAVESILESYKETFGLEYTILRYGSLYGPRAQKWNGMKRFVTQAVKEGKIIYPGTGEERREYIHVKDAAKLSLEALSPEYANQCLTITGSQILTTKEAMNMIREILGRKIDIDFSLEDSNYNMSHYSLTPYRYTPRRGKKIVPKVFIDIGQGILELIEEIDNSYNANCDEPVNEK